MKIDNKIPEPLLFNPLKHYLPFIKELINKNIPCGNCSEPKDLIRELRHIGNCVMDIYTGSLTQEMIFREVCLFLEENRIITKESYKLWTGTGYDDFKIIPLSDWSRWTLKYFNNDTRYVHIFPARQSPHTFRIKANTLKSAVLYLVLIGKDYITEDDLNKARALAGLSPVRDISDTEAVTEMIEILRK